MFEYSVIMGKGLIPRSTAEVSFAPSSRLSKQWLNTMVTLFGDRAHNSRGQSRTQSECLDKSWTWKNDFAASHLLLAGRVTILDPSRRNPRLSRLYRVLRGGTPIVVLYSVLEFTIHATSGWVVKVEFPET
jgi:hypothetical protein